MAKNVIYKTFLFLYTTIGIHKNYAAIQLDSSIG